MTTPVELPQAHPEFYPGYFGYLFTMLMHFYLPENTQLFLLQKTSNFLAGSCCSEQLKIVAGPRQAKGLFLGELIGFLKSFSERVDLIVLYFILLLEVADSFAASA
jgi:hypothetical protein